MNRVTFAVVRLLTLGRWPASPSRAPSARRRVWRITDSKPEGEWVEIDDSGPPRSTTPADFDDRPTLPMDSWATSSMDLRDGMHVVELDHPPGDDAARPR
ncbi:hypothetical protein [Piscinibacter sp.]|uniref:hypothetical protein n=1 Tax=Piscinibacter sp. TaxID=1903157 RepID=UPI0039E2FE1E